MGGSGEQFPETVWASVLGQEGPPTPRSQAAFEELARLYWRPVYKYIRTAGGASIEDAKDLCQEFFGYLLEGRALAKYDRERGRFRSYLKAVLANFLSASRRDAQRLKRGGGRVFVPLDVAALETADFAGERRTSTPDEIFDRQWVREILAEAVGELRRRLVAEGRELHARVYELYHGLAPGAGDAPTYASVAAAAGLEERQVKDHLGYARGRLEKILRERLARRLPSEREISAEINDALFG